MKVRNPSIPATSDDPKALVKAVQALKESMEIAQRLRGDPLDSFVRLRELQDLGILRNPGGDAGVVTNPTDHGALTGLLDDDHTQYFNQARGDARYSQLGHTHAASEITSGTFADARIAQSNVTQHEGALGTSSATANTIMRRDGSGYAYAVYFNQSSSNSENPTISQIMVTNGSDDFLRKASLAHLISQGALVQTSRTIATQHSLAGGGDLSADRTLSLVNDLSSPGANKFYGTDGSGVRGWYAVSTGVTDHGALTGLGDDDHIQYFNQARGDARYLRLTGGALSGDLGIRGGPLAATLDIYDSHGNYPVTKALLRITNTHPNGQSVIDFLHNNQLRARIRSDYVGGLVFAAHDQILFYTGGDHDTGWQRMVLQNNGTLLVNAGAAIRFDHANQTNLDDGMIAAGRFGTGLNIVGVQTSPGSGRQIRMWGNLYWQEGAPVSNTYYGTDTNKKLWTNDSTFTYGGWILSGARNSYTGLVLDDSAYRPTFMTNGVTCGVYFQGPGRWSWYDDGTYFNIVRQPRIPVGGALTYWVHNTYTSGAMTVSSSAPTPEGIGHIWFEV